MSNWLFDPKLAISFHAVASHGSVTAGARALGVAQPWMSEQIRKLEEQLGYRLMTRTSRKLELSASGKLFLPYAKAVAEANQAAQDFASQHRAHKHQSLRVGASQFTIGMAERSNLLENLLKRYPELKLELQIGRTADLIDMLLAGSIDAAIVHQLGILDNPAIVDTCIAHRYGALIVPKDDPLAQCEAIDPASIKGRELFVAPGNDDARSLSRSLERLVEAGAILRHCPVIDRSVIEAMALHNRGLCVLWSEMPISRHQRGQQICIPLAGLPLFSPISLARRLTDDVSRPVRWIWNIANSMTPANAYDPPCPPAV